MKTAEVVTLDGCVKFNPCHGIISFSQLSECWFVQNHKDPKR